MAQQNTNMKKENHIIAKAAIGAYLFVLTASCAVGNLESEVRAHNKLVEIEMSVDELSYYVQEDVHNGNLNSDIEWAYTKEINKINKLIQELKDE